jgi:hypothetical protein
MGGKGLEQRLVAILAADRAGYSRLMAADERATVAALDAARAVFRHQVESIPGSPKAMFLPGGRTAARNLLPRRLGGRRHTSCGNARSRADGTVSNAGQRDRATVWPCATSP